MTDRAIREHSLLHDFLHGKDEGMEGASRGVAEELESPGFLESDFGGQAAEGLGSQGSSTESFEEVSRVAAIGAGH